MAADGPTRPFLARVLPRRAGRLGGRAVQPDPAHGRRRRELGALARSHRQPRGLFAACHRRGRQRRRDRRRARPGAAAGRRRSSASGASRRLIRARGSAWRLRSQAVVATGLRGSAWRSHRRGRELEGAGDAARRRRSTAGMFLADGRLVLVTQQGELLLSADRGESFSKLPPVHGLPSAHRRRWRWSRAGCWSAGRAACSAWRCHRRGDAR